MHLPIGFILNRTYRIERVLGQGGFGITYLATDLNLDRKVAIKEFFPKEFCERDDNRCDITMGTTGSKELVTQLKQKFIKEAKTIARHDESPYIIRIFSAFEANNTAYYVMEYIEGENLSETVKRQGPLSASLALDYIKKVGEALRYIHGLNINHLDVKPANILIKKSINSPVLIDFGLSKHYDYEGHQTSTTPTGISNGFAPIEQYRTGGLRDFSPETDIYSLGATLYFLLTAIIPPQSIDLVSNDLYFPSQFPKHLIPVVKKAMALQKKDRYHNIAEFQQALETSTNPPYSNYQLNSDSETTRTYETEHETEEKVIVAQVENRKTPKKLTWERILYTIGLILLIEGSMALLISIVSNKPTDMDFLYCMITFISFGLIILAWLYKRRRKLKKEK